MWHAWEASTHGFFLQFMVKTEGKNTPELKALQKRWIAPCHAALKRARIAHPDSRVIELAALYPELGDALGAYASDLKQQIENPFPRP